MMILHGHEKRVECVAFSPDGFRLASVSKDRTLRLWNLNDGSSRLLASGDLGWGFRDDRVAFSPDGRWLAHRCSGGPLRVWEVDSRKRATQLMGRNEHGYGWGLAPSPGGEVLVCINWVPSVNYRVRRWDTATWSALPDLVTQPESPHVVALAFEPSGSRLALSN